MRAILLGILAFVTVGILAPASSSAREIVRFNGYSAGTIIVKTNERRLYYILDDGKAIRDPLSGGRRQGRYGLVRNGLHRWEIHQAGMDGAGLDQKGPYPDTVGHPGWQSG